MSKKLKNLDEYNAQHNKLHWHLNSNEPQLNGIACPKCGAELYDSNPMEILTSMPPKKKVRCSKCGYVGYRVA